MEPTNHFLHALEGAVVPFHHNNKSYQTLLEQIKDARFVLIGEASYGTHEFYQIRAELTKYLIQEKRFNAIAIEGDWPDAYQVNHYTYHDKTSGPEGALSNFKRFPAWMWRNNDVLHFIK